jgi:hypothetical protein
MFMVGHIFDRSVRNLKPTIIFIWPYAIPKYFVISSQDRATIDAWNYRLIGTYKEYIEKSSFHYFILWKHLFSEVKFLYSYIILCFYRNYRTISLTCKYSRIKKIRTTLIKNWHYSTSKSSQHWAWTMDHAVRYQIT